MTRFLLRVTLMSALLFCTLIGIVRAQSTPDQAIRAAFTSDLTCATPCWNGIAVGVTRRAEVLDRLQSDPNVQQVFEQPSFITWKWSSAAPPFIDRARDGVISLQGNRVTQIRIPSTLQFGAVWLAFGAPDSALLVRPVSRSTAFQISSYDEARLRVVSTLACPALPARLWYSSTTIGLGDVSSTEALNSITFDVYRASGWWRYLYPCRPPRSTRPR